jgi:hypothetical protein
MEEFLKQMIGKEIDAAFGASSIVRGKVIDVKDGILFLEDEYERTAYAAINKITVVWECKEPHSRPGFVV